MASSIRFKLQAADGSDRDYDHSDDVEVFDTESHLFTNDSRLGSVAASRSPSISSQGPGLEQWSSIASLQDENSARVGPDNSICYGTICSIPIQFVGGQLAHDILQGLTAVQSAGGDLVPLKVFMHETRTELGDLAGRSIAVLDSATHRILASLRALEPTNFQALYRRKLLDGNGEQTATKASRSKKAKRKMANECAGLEVEINVYGIREQADTVGELLSQENIFLQDPSWVPLNMRYDNPQLLKLPDYVSEDDMPDIISQPRGKPDLASQSNAELLRSDPNALLDKLASYRDLNEVSVDGRIRTQLLGHQRKGIDFMMRREAGSVVSSDGTSLWEKISMDSGEFGFRHSITGYKSLKPAAFYGGLLADDMGLGKSLTVIATIAASLNHVPFLSREMMTQYDPASGEPIPTTSTLIVVPSALLIDNWIEEINCHVHASDFTFYKYHGFRRKIPWSTLLQRKVVFTTYGTVESELRRNSGILHKILWYRVVLDEAHLVRNKSTKQFKGVDALQARIRWCLTGTPIQNGLEDLGTLIRFLGFPVLDDDTQFRRHIIKPCKADDPSFDNLQSLLDHACLRRSRSLLNLPSETEITHKLRFSDQEAAGYRQIINDFKSALASLVSGVSVKKDLNHLFEAILRLRVFCNNGNYFAEPSRLAMTDDEIKENLLQQSDSAACYNCTSPVIHLDRVIESPDSGFITGCEKVLCSDCSGEYFEQSVASARCTLCNEVHDIVGQIDRLQVDDRKPVKRRYPTKMLAVRDAIRVDSESTKSIVFSFWTKSLDVLGEILQESGIGHLRIDGTSTLDARRRILEEFKMTAEKAILLITFGIGAVGLNNLSVANRVHILEPQWNPYVESQAIGRLLRLGQQQQVQINRYIMLDTIESSVQTKQIQKLRLAEGGFGKRQTINAKEEIAAKLMNLASREM